MIPMEMEPLACQAALDGMPGETAAFHIPAPSAPFQQLMVAGRHASEIERLTLRVFDIRVFEAQPRADGNGRHWMRIAMLSQVIGTVRGNDCFVFEAIRFPGFYWRALDQAILWVEFSQRAKPDGKTLLYAM